MPSSMSGATAVRAGARLCLGTECVVKAVLASLTSARTQPPLSSPLGPPQPDLTPESSIIPSASAKNVHPITPIITPFPPPSTTTMTSRTWILSTLASLRKKQANLTQRVISQTCQIWWMCPGGRIAVEILCVFRSDCAEKVRIDDPNEELCHTWGCPSLLCTACRIRRRSHPPRSHTALSDMNLTAIPMRHHTGHGGSRDQGRGWVVGMGMGMGGCGWRTLCSKVHNTPPSSHRSMREAKRVRQQPSFLLLRFLHKQCLEYALTLDPSPPRLHPPT